jgi:hypothetical protein
MLKRTTTTLNNINTINTTIITDKTTTEECFASGFGQSTRPDYILLCIWGIFKEQQLLQRNEVYIRDKVLVQQ